MVNDTELISVIIPVYNTEKYITQCLESVLNQSYQNLEILIIDDGSTDSSGEICDRFGREDSRVKVIHNHNCGVSASRNLGIDESQGKYISFIDSDDYINENFYETLIKNIKKYDAQCSVIAHRRYYEKSNRFENATKDFGIKILNGFEALNQALDKQDLWVGYPVNKLFVRKLIVDNYLRFNENIIFCEDSLFCYQYLDLCTTVVRDSTVLYTYRINSGSITNSIFKDYNKLKKYPLVTKELYKFACKHKGERIFKSISEFCIDMHLTYLYYMFVNSEYDIESIKSSIDFIGYIQTQNNDPLNISKGKKLFYDAIKISPKLTYLAVKVKGA